MGMFDYLRCEYPLPVEGRIPEGAANAMQFQTKSLDCLMDEYTITEEGELIGQYYDIEDQSDPDAEGKRLHRKVARQRKDALHKFTRGIVNKYQNIIVGDVSSAALAKTRMAKSVADAGWHTLKTQLQYKGQQAGRSVHVVNEAYTTRACSSCGQHTGPSGLRQLAVREWQCVKCGVTHDRDVNAARNIAKLGSGCRTSVSGNGLRLSEVAA